MKSKGKILIIILFIGMLSAIGVLAYMVLNPKEATVQQEQQGSLLIDESNLEEVVESISESVSEGMFEVNMNTTWRFPDGKSASSNAYVANGMANTYPISFEVVLGEEVIYSSTIIPVGKQIKEIVLEKELEAGTYDAVCVYHLLNQDGTEKSEFGVNIRLLIGE